MSVQKEQLKKRTVSFIRSKKNKDKLVCLTAYDYDIASVIDPFCDIILVGDSVGNVVYGFDTTLPVSLSIIKNHAKAVAKATNNALIVVDMPFSTYENGDKKAFKNCAKIIKIENVDAVKLECKENNISTIKYLTERGIAVMAHIGLLPQSISLEGKYKIQKIDEMTRLLELAKKCEEAGAFSLVIEAVDEKIAKEISATISIPTIGIGASAFCDGQILVINDVLGLTKRQAKFVKKYLNLRDDIENAVANYASDVKQGLFPSKDNIYKSDK